MPRPYHSASSIATGDHDNEGCEYAWGLQYLHGIRDPEIAWIDIEAGYVKVLPWGERVPRGRENDYCTVRQRSTALGKAVHAIGEDYYLGRTDIDWQGLPGRIFESGRHLLPCPDKCMHIEVERSIGIIPSGLPADAIAGGAPPTVLVVHGVKWAGFKDLRVSAPAEELSRIAAPASAETHGLLIDYKSTSSIAKYALTVEGLAAGVQRNLYALDDLERLPRSLRGPHDVDVARWLYLETKDTRRALPVDSIVTRQSALAVMARAAKVARHLDTIRDLKDARYNTLACPKYGGCPHHVTAGGTCSARRSPGAMIQARTRKVDSTMALTDAQRAAFAAAKQSTPAATTAPETPAEVAPAAAAAPRAPRAPRVPRTPAAVVEAPPVAPDEAPVAAPATVDQLATIASLTDQINTARDMLELKGANFVAAQETADAARAELDAAQADADRLLAELRGAL